MLIRCAVTALALSVAPWSFAQYPARPIHLIVPIPPGGAPDIAARVLGQKLSEQMGQPVLVGVQPAFKEKEPRSQGGDAGA